MSFHPHKIWTYRTDRKKHKQRAEAGENGKIATMLNKNLNNGYCEKQQQAMDGTDGSVYSVQTERKLQPKHDA